MEEYNKIESLFNRDKETFKFIEGDFRLPEFEYLKDNVWTYTEKIDGTNIRIGWNGEDIEIGGRTNNAQIPTFLLARINELFTKEKLVAMFNENPAEEVSVVLFCEGYGAKIQKGGGNYILDGVDLALFDIKIGVWWLKREDVEGIAQSLGLGVVPLVGEGTIAGAVLEVKNGYASRYGNFLAEGMVLRPKVELKSRSGHRIITKLKNKDF